jgi:predicted DNA-binding transcriptional regulator AlpA
VRFLSYDDLKGKGIGYCKSQIWRLRQLPPGDPRKFPDPVRGLGQADAWREDEIDAYISARVAERTAA